MSTKTNGCLPIGKTDKERADSINQPVQPSSSEAPPDSLYQDMSVPIEKRTRLREEREMATNFFG